MTTKQVATVAAVTGLAVGALIVSGWQRWRAWRRQTHKQQAAATKPAATSQSTTTTSCSVRMPAEWEPHTQCWMGWPQRPGTWPGTDCGPARKAFAAVATAIARFEPVTVCAPPGTWASARAALPHNIRVVEMSMDDSWFRDTAPTFVLATTKRGTSTSITSTRTRTTTQQELRGVNWIFNAWGDTCYADYAQDQAVKAKLAQLAGRAQAGRWLPVPLSSPGIVMEGGSFHVDGQGTLLTTEECLLNPNRNPDLSKAQIEAALCAELGVTVVIWLPFGVAGDVDTSGHVDNFACFLRPGVVALHWAEEEEDAEQYGALLHHHAATWYSIVGPRAHCAFCRAVCYALLCTGMRAHWRPSRC